MDCQTLRALIIEDNNDDAELLLLALKKGGFAPDAIRVDTKTDLLEALKSPWDIIFSDYSMPNLNGFEALKLVREIDLDIPYIYVSGTIGEDRAVEAIRMGAQDYFIKGDLKRLPAVVTRELQDSHTRRHHRLSQSRIHYLANYDALTGLPNRVLFQELLAQHIANARQPQTACVFILNLDRFRNVNDHLGPAAGDELLVDLAKRLRETVGDAAVVARLSADEFAIIVADLKGEAEATVLAKKILSVLTKPFVLSRYEWRMSASMGCALFPADHAVSDDVMNDAMMALHHAQQTAGTRFFFYSEDMRVQLHQRLQLTHDLEHAVEDNQFELHYQPQVLVSSGEIIGVEALIRWQRPHQPVSPAQFIPVAEESGLIVALGEWTLREACRQIVEWRSRNLSSPHRVAVNVSAYQFHQRDLVAKVCHVLHEFGLPASFLEIEITETALMQDASNARKLLADLKDMGVSIALDDFGTGYSSLSYLKRFPVDIIKIDQSFVRDLPGDQDDAAIVRAIIAMAEKLNMQVIAEGVETIEQLAFLRDTGCNMVQGYFLQRPSAASNLLPVLEDGSIIRLS